MNIKNLWVGNVYQCLGFDGETVVITEPGRLIEKCVLERQADGTYRSLHDDEVYTTKDIFGKNKVEKNSLKPLTAYYTPYLKIKKNHYSDSKIVHSNVKILKKAGKI